MIYDLFEVILSYNVQIYYCIVELQWLYDINVDLYIGQQPDCGVINNAVALDSSTMLECVL